MAKGYKSSAELAKMDKEGEEFALRVGKELAEYSIEAVTRQSHARDYLGFLEELTSREGSHSKINRGLKKAVRQEERESGDDCIRAATASEAVLGDEILREAAWGDLVERLNK
jgi:23S rRNA maturation mini-RNase III